MAKNSEILKNGFWGANPVITQVLGICSALAVTTKLDKSVVMALALTTVLVLSNVIISAMRKWIPGNVRMIVELLVVATLVIITDQVLKAFVYSLSKELSVFVGLIITNCIVMGRAEAFALGNPVGKSALDGIGNGFGYGALLILVGFVRELLGSGMIWNYPVLEKFGLYEIGYQNMGIMVLAPGAFFIISLIIWGHQQLTLKKGAH